MEYSWILWPPDAKNWLLGKYPDAGKDWRQEEMGMTEEEMFRWHHQLNGHEFKQAPGDDEGPESLVYCSPWGHKESDMTKQLNGNKYTARQYWPLPMEYYIFMRSVPWLIRKSGCIYFSSFSVVIGTIPWDYRMSLRYDDKSWIVSFKIHMLKF